MIYKLSLECDYDETSYRKFILYVGKFENNELLEESSIDFSTGDPVIDFAGAIASGREFNPESFEYHKSVDLFIMDGNGYKWNDEGFFIIRV